MVWAKAAYARLIGGAANTHEASQPVDAAIPGTNVAPGQVGVRQPNPFSQLVVLQQLDVCRLKYCHETMVIEFGQQGNIMNFQVGQ